MRQGRKRFVWIDPAPGRNLWGWVELEDRPPPPRQHIISDHADAFRSQLDGREYESKSQYRRTLKEAGLVEMGSDVPDPQPFRPLPGWEPVINDAMQQHGI